MSRTAPEERAMEQIYNAFTVCVDNEQWEAATHCIYEMNEYDQNEAKKMEAELKARREEEPI